MGLKSVIMAASPEFYWPLNDGKPLKPAAGSLAMGAPVNHPEFKKSDLFVDEAGSHCVGFVKADNSHFNFGVNGLSSLVSGNPTVLTFAFAIKVASGDTTTGRILWKCMHNTTSGILLTVLRSPTRLEAGGRSTTADSFLAKASSAITEDEWHLVIMEYAYTAKTIKIWVDGTLVGDGSSIAFGANSYTPGTPTGIDALGVDSTVTAGSSITGSLVHFAAWKRALTTGEFNSLVAAWNERPEFTGSITESLPVGRWKVSAHRADTGEFVNSVSVTGASYTLPVNSYDPHTLTLEPFDYPWTANKAVALGDYIVPTDADATPHVFEVTTAGDLGATEPSYNLAGTTSSGTAVLTYVGALVTPLSLGPKVPD